MLWLTLISFRGSEESTHQINLLTSPTFLPKVKDQGKFTLPCTLGHIELDNALVDSGASINLISLTMAEKLALLEHCSALLLQSCLEMQLLSLLLVCSRTIT
ncbi:unnamed protein product [Microthlaspi erraticum]|uniref:Aspartic peptidase DDI1-type domain-containing protein n=1 Tax=Microthlaspi erraticum TaxID=1685480 RepID=A0A6D2KPV4_9BRAS|nr:unnamed protein product [Microthlaspi erraticum]